MASDQNQSAASTVDIVRQRLADGRTISDGDVHNLVSEIDRLRHLLIVVVRGNPTNSEWFDVLEACKQ